MALGRTGTSLQEFLEDVGIGIPDSSPPRNVLHRNTVAEMTKTYRTDRRVWDQEATVIEGIVAAILAPPPPPVPVAQQKAQGTPASSQDQHAVPNTSQLSEPEIELLIRTIMAEAGNQPYDGQVAVAAASMNYIKYVKWHKKSLMQALRDPNFIEAVKNPATRHWYTVPLNTIPALATKRRAVMDAAAGRHKVGKRNHWWTTALIAKVGFPSFGRPESRLIIGAHTFFSEKGSPI